jgi:hypothetical protein
LDVVGAPDRLGAGLGQAEVPHLPRPDQVLDRSSDVLDRHLGVDAVLIQQVDGVDAEALERTVHGLADVLGAAGEAHLPTFLVEAEPELGGDDHLVAEGGEGLTHELLVHERAIHLGGVEEGDPPLHRRPDHRDALLPVRGRAKAGADTHAAEPDRRDLQVTVAKHSRLHSVSFDSLLFLVRPCLAPHWSLVQSTSCRRMLVTSALVQRGASLIVAARASGLTPPPMIRSP